MVNVTQVYDGMYNNNSEAKKENSYTHDDIYLYDNECGPVFVQ